MKRDLTDKSVENRPASRILLENKLDSEHLENIDGLEGRLDVYQNVFY